MRSKFIILEKWHRDGKSEPYETGGITKTHIDKIDPLNPTVCPHCGGKLRVDRRRNVVKSCLSCGYEDIEMTKENRIRIKNDMFD